MRLNSNKIFWAIILYFFIYSFLFFYKPPIFFNLDGSIRDFGIGYRNKTILPLWLFSILLGILSYLFVLYFNYYLIHYI